MGTGHLKNILDGQCPNITVKAMADIDPANLDRAAKLCPEAKAFATDDELIKSGLVDAVLIAVPHYDHPTIAIKCFEHGLHVITEKPAGVYTRQVREMNDAAKKAGVVFGIMFNQRSNPMYAKAKEIVSSGRLGELKRMVWIITNWYRSQAYYNSGSWRATWSGEGGGVLLNQAPHNLDLWQWIFGMPKKVRAFCSFGKYHDIAVEDDVTIYGEYENGATATFITTTGEAPGTNRLEISGDRGKIVIEEGKLKWTKLKVPEREFCFTCKTGFEAPESEYEEFTAPEPEGHVVILNNFADAVLKGTEMIAPGYEGINSLSLSNAAYISAWKDDWAEIPVDEEFFETKLRELSKNEKKSGVILPPEPIEILRKRWRVRW